MRVIPPWKRAFALRNIASYKAEESVTHAVTFNRVRCTRSIKTFQEMAGSGTPKLKGALDVFLMTASSNFAYTKTRGYTAIAFHVPRAAHTISAPTRGRGAQNVAARA
jgi:hypothetical protein